jgi:hypothetical protein
MFCPQGYYACVKNHIFIIAFVRQIPSVKNPTSLWCYVILKGIVKLPILSLVMIYFQEMVSTTKHSQGEPIIKKYNSQNMAAPCFKSCISLFGR